MLIVLTYDISRLCILLYYNKWGKAVIHSLPEGYKLKGMYYIIMAWLLGTYGNINCPNCPRTTSLDSGRFTAILNPWPLAITITSYNFIDA